MPTYLNPEAASLLQAMKIRRHTLPTLASVAVELWALAWSEDLEPQTMAHVLARDPVLAGRVLGMAHAPPHRGAGPSLSLASAMERIGMSRVMDLVLETAATVSILEAPEYRPFVDACRRHALAVGQLAIEAARATGHDPSLAFLAGAVHDTGSVALLLVAGDEAHRDGRRHPSVASLLPHIEAAHVEASAYLAEQWRLPVEVVDVIRRHGSVPRGRGDLLVPVAAADLLARTVVGCPEPGEQPVVDVDRELEALGLTRRGRQRLRSVAQRVAHSIRSMPHLAA